jgi:hypothetical protein
MSSASNFYKQTNYRNSFDIRASIIECSKVKMKNEPPSRLDIPFLTLYPDDLRKGVILPSISSYLKIKRIILITQPIPAKHQKEHIPGLISFPYLLKY